MYFTHCATAPLEASGDGDGEGTAPALFPACSKPRLEHHVDPAAHHL